MSDSGIVVTYSGADSLLDSAAFSHLIGTFSHHLPLRNLHWKPSTSYASSSSSSPPSPFNASLPQPTSIRTIQSLGVRLEPIADTLLRTKLKPETRHLIQRSLLERPFCHLYFVVCDDSDTYRTQVRNDIRSWLSTVQGSPTLSAASVSAKGFQEVESLQHHKNGSVTSLSNGGSASRSETPPIRPETPSKDSAEEAPSPSSSKEKAPPPSPEYLIVLITPPEGSALALPTKGRGSPAPPFNASGEQGEKPNKTGLGRFYSSSSSSKASVVDKVKADFNTARRERVVHLTRLPVLNSNGSSQARHSDPTIFADLQTRLKECVSATFDAVVEMQGDIVKREGSKRNVPGWNFCKWMAGMECVASTFEGVGLWSDALAQYEEIEAGFLLCLQERNLPFFSHVGPTSAGDDSAPLLDVGKKNYRELILRNDITLFDFRTYVFAKRANLLGKLGRVSQVMNETPVFLSGVGSMLQSESLPRHFLESWIFSCSIDVVEQCQAWLVERGDVSAPGMEEDIDATQKSPLTRAMDGQLSAAFHSAKAELLDLARRQLDKIGVAVGHLPNAVPFSLSLRQQDAGEERALPALPDELSATRKGTQSPVQGAITRQELLSAIESREIFDLHYVSLTERVVAGWVSGARHRNVLRLRSVLGSLDFFRQRYEEAYAKFTTLPEPYAEGHWTVIESSHLAKQLECHDQLKKPLDRAWASVVIALLEACPPHKSSKISSGPGLVEDSSLRWLDPAFLYSQLREKTKAFAQEMPVSRFEAIRVHVQEQVAQIAAAGSQDGAELSARVENRSECAVEVDDVRVCLISGAGKELWFTSGRTTLGTGDNELVLTCLQSGQAGKYVVDVSQIRLSKVIVQYVHRKSKEDSRDATFVDVLEDGDALHASLQLSNRVWLDQSRLAMLSVWTGRNDLERCTIQLLYKDNRTPVKGLFDAQLLQNEGTFTASLKIEQGDEGNELVLEGAPSQSTLTLSIPLHDFTGAADGNVTFLLQLDYWNKRQDKDSSASTRKRQLKTELRLAVGLPLGVNVQDFFRQDRLFSKFLISAGTGGMLRLGAVRLECEAGKGEAKDEGAFEILSSQRQVNETIVTPSQTASYVFAISRKEGKRASNRNLRLTLSYQTLHDEAIHSVLSHLDKVVAQREPPLSNAHKRCLQHALTSFVSSEMDVSKYHAQGRLHFAPRSAQRWGKLCEKWAGVEDKTGVDAIRQIIMDTLHAASEGKIGAEAEWRELSLIVDVPRMTVVNAVTIELQAGGEDVRVGQVVKATVIIETSFHWDSDDDENDNDEGPGAGTETDPITPKSVHLSVDVQCDFLNWLLVGSKRTVVKVSAPAERSSTVQSKLHLSLVAMKSGNLYLPGVTIWPLADPMETTPPSRAHRDKESNAVQYDEDKRRLSHAQSINCDSYLTNEAQTVVVLPSLQAADRRTYWMDA